MFSTMKLNQELSSGLAHSVTVGSSAFTLSMLTQEMKIFSVTEQWVLLEHNTR